MSLLQRAIGSSLAGVRREGEPYIFNLFGNEERSYEFLDSVAQSLGDYSCRVSATGPFNPISPEAVAGRRLVVVQNIPKRQEEKILKKVDRLATDGQKIWFCTSKAVTIADKDFASKVLAIQYVATDHPDLDGGTSTR